MHILICRFIGTHLSTDKTWYESMQRQHLPGTQTQMSYLKITFQYIIGTIMSNMGRKKIHLLLDSFLKSGYKKGSIILKIKKCWLNCFDALMSIKRHCEQN